MTLAYGQLSKTIQFRQEVEQNRVLLNSVPLVKFCPYKVVGLGCQTALLKLLEIL